MISSLARIELSVALTAVVLCLAACSRSEPEPPAAPPPVASAAPVAVTPVQADPVATSTPDAPAPDAVTAEPERAAPASPPPAVAVPPPAPAVVAVPAAFASCSSCHSVTEGGPNRMGPNLFGIVGDQAGTRQGYTYSPAMAGSGVVWTEQTLDQFLAAPRDVVPGTKMAAAPVRSPEARRSIIDYLAGLK